jgi:hypothetical protein
MVDGTQIHTANVTKSWMEELGLKMLNWPPNGPHLNPLENLWMIYKDWIQSMNRPKNKNQMWDAVSVAWESIPMEILQKLVVSMPNHMQAVIATEGDNTR